MTVTDPPFSTVAPTTERIVVRPLPGIRRGQRLRRLERLLYVLVVGACAVGVMLRFTTASSLWLDEALTVNISRLALPQLFAALRHDGSPPLYYLLLHFWMLAFGTSDVAVRALPMLMSVVTLPVAWMLGHEVGGRRGAVTTTVLFVTSPFAIRYASENRMYALVMLLAAVGGLALVRALKDPTRGALATVALCSGLLLLTHYWALYLVAATIGVLVVANFRREERSSARLALGATLAGTTLFLPWAPAFVFQVLHTGTPWGTPASPMLFFDTIGEFAHWETALGIVLFVGYLVCLGLLAILVVVSTMPAARRLAGLLGLRTQLAGERWVPGAASVVFGTLLIALVGGYAVHATYATRYASVVFPGFAVLVALGMVAVGTTRAGSVATAALLLTAALIGVAAGSVAALENRTEAAVVAARIRSVARRGDVVAYCPDQLGPAVSRLLPNRYIQVTYPRFDPPQLINWVDYAKVNANAMAPGLAARELINLAGPTHQVWLVWEAGYRTLGQDCPELRDSLGALRPNFTEPVRSQPQNYYEHESLARFAP